MRFNKGDRVRRTGVTWNGVVTGKTYKVADTVANGAWLELEGVNKSLGHRCPFQASQFELVKAGRPQFAPGIDGEVNQAERRSAQLRSLRSLANKLGYTLVKNTDQEVTA